MRPARKGPENPRPGARPRPRAGSFNEAGPQGAGKPNGARMFMITAMDASMRPARKGPENRIGAVPGAFSPQ